MSNINQPSFERNINPTTPKLVQKKLIAVSLILLGLSIALFFFLQQKRKQTPNELETLNQYQTDYDLQSDFTSNLLDYGDYGYELKCQIYLEELFYPKEQLGNYIIQAAAPCWFYDKDKQMTSVDIPVVVEETVSQRWAHVGMTEFIPVFTTLDKDIAILGFSKYIFAGPNNGQAPIMYDSVLIMLHFGLQGQYVDYQQAHFELTGEYIPKPKYYSEKWLLELANQEQNKAAIDYFIENGQWNKNLDDYLFYYYSEKKS